MVAKRGCVNLADLAQHFAGARVDVDEDHPAVVDELEPIGDRRRIVLGPQVLHALHGRQDLLLDLAQRTNVAGAEFLAHLTLGVTWRGRQNGSNRNGNRKCGKDNQTLHDPAEMLRSA
jgi:hypothetical protein